MVPRCDRDLHRDRSKSGSRSNGQSGRRGSEHNRSRADSARQYNETLIADVICYKCQGRGHMASECPTSKSLTKENEKVTGKRYVNKPMVPKKIREVEEIEIQVPQEDSEYDAGGPANRSQGSGEALLAEPPPHPPTSHQPSYTVGLFAVCTCRPECSHCFC